MFSAPSFGAARRGIVRGGASMLATLLVFAQFSAGPATGQTAPGQALDLGTRWELFVDNFLVAAARGAALKLHEPRRAEVVLVLDAPWEGPTSAYFSVLRDGDVIRLYYRGSVAGSDHSDNQVTCVAESRDGIHFTRPKLGIVEVNGSKDNLSRSNCWTRPVVPSRDSRWPTCRRCLAMSLMPPCDGRRAPTSLPSRASRCACASS
jgi:hypothetical protein